MTLTFSRFLKCRVHQSPVVIDLSRALLNTPTEPQNLDQVFDALHRYRASQCGASKRWHSDVLVADLWKSFERCLRASEAA